MIRLVMHRIELSNVATRSVVTLNGTLLCVAIEDVVRHKKIALETAIPAGTYDVIVNHSPRFNRLMPLLLDVPNYSGVRIHTGNTPRDTEGCIIVADNYDYDALGNVKNSKPAYARLMQSIGQCITRGSCSIKIINH